MKVAVLLGGHACDTLEIAVERGGFGESEQEGGLLKCLCGAGLDEAFGLCRHREIGLWQQQVGEGEGIQTVLWGLIALLSTLSSEVFAQNIFQRADSILTQNYRKGDIDSVYIMRPQKKWTIAARFNVSGTEIAAEGRDEGRHFKSKMEANKKATISLGVSYLGVSLNAALNPAQLSGKSHDNELNINSYGRRFGFDFIYQDAKNFTGWHDHEGMERIYLPDDMLKVRTLNVNAFYVFNSRRFSYPAAFSQSYIQRRSAGSFLLAASGQGQYATLDWEQEGPQVGEETSGTMKLKMTNIGLGAGYGYNYVPGKGWLLHISALPTFIVYSKTSMNFGDTRVPLHYHFPEVIITGRGAVVYQWSNTFLGTSMVFNFTNVGHEDNLALHNIKWRIRTFFGLRL